MESERPFLAALLQGQDDSTLARERAETLLGVFLEVCAALDVTDPADPRGPRIARTLILLAADGNRDVEALRARTIEQVKLS